MNQRACDSFDELLDGNVKGKNNTKLNKHCAKLVRSKRRSSRSVNTAIQMSVEKRAVDVANTFTKELERDMPDPTRCLDLLRELEKNIRSMNNSSMESCSTEKALMKSIRSIKRHKRTSERSDEWERVHQMMETLLDDYKSFSKKKQEADAQDSASLLKPGEAMTVTEYRMRLVSQKKDMYKDPPVLPPTSIEVEHACCPLPKRNNETGALSFTANDGDVAQLLKDFHPNRSPEEILRAGSFGGTYFRPIISAVTNVHYRAQDVLKTTVDEEWIKGLPRNKFTSKTYRERANKFQVKCGGSLGMWESSGWITHVDPYGWFQWYCRFYQGRRCQDDARQISRWLKSAGPKGRFRSQLCNKILAAGTTHEDISISPVIRQTLLHWGLEITPQVLANHAKRVRR